MESPLRREQIADAALTLVVEQGLGAVTVRRVAEAVGISAAALYRHYKNKADILQVILEEHQGMHLADLVKAKAQAKSPLDALRLHYVAAMRLVERYRALPVVFLSDILWFEEPRLKELKLEHHHTIRASLVKLIMRAQDEGEIRNDIRAEELFVHYLGLIAMPALMLVRDTEDVDMERQVKANWSLFVKAVQP